MSKYADMRVEAKNFAKVALSMFEVASEFEKLTPAQEKAILEISESAIYDALVHQDPPTAI